MSLYLQLSFDNFNLKKRKNNVFRKEITYCEALLPILKPETENFPLYSPVYLNTAWQEKMKTKIVGCFSNRCCFSANTLGHLGLQQCNTEEFGLPGVTQVFLPDTCSTELRGMNFELCKHSSNQSTALLQHSSNVPKCFLFLGTLPFSLVKRYLDE